MENKCDCCDVELKPIYGKKGSIIDFQCTRCGKLNSDLFEVIYCCSEGNLSVMKGGNRK